MVLHKKRYGTKLLGVSVGWFYTKKWLGINDLDLEWGGFAQKKVWDQITWS